MLIVMMRRGRGRHWERGQLSGQNAGHVMERSRVRVPVGATEELSSPGSTFCGDS